MKNILQFKRSEKQLHNLGLTLKAEKEKKKAEIAIYDVITPYADEYWGGVSLKMIDKEIKNLPADTEELMIRLNSPGGDVFQGVSIYNRFVELKKKMKVSCVIDGLAASIASVIAMAGDEIIMSTGSMMMIHKPWSLTVGNSSEHEEKIKLLDKLEYNMVGIYKKKSPLSREEIESLLAEETWMNAEEAKDKGFCTMVSDEQDAQIAASALSMEWFNRAPKIENTIENALRAERKEKFLAQKKRIGECLARS